MGGKEVHYPTYYSKHGQIKHSFQSKYVLHSGCYHDNDIEQQRSTDLSKTIQICWSQYESILW